MKSRWITHMAMFGMVRWFRVSRCRREIFDVDVTHTARLVSAYPDVAWFYCSVENITNLKFEEYDGCVLQLTTNGLIHLSVPTKRWSITNDPELRLGTMYVKSLQKREAFAFASASLFCNPEYRHLWGFCQIQSIFFFMYIDEEKFDRNDQWTFRRQYQTIQCLTWEHMFVSLYILWHWF